MSSPLGRSVRLFLVVGTATGLITAEIMNWTGHVLAGSRSDLAAFLKRQELDRTGIYFLTGPDPTDPDPLQLYIGESDNVRKRLVQHSKDEKKDLWERTCVVTSKDQNIAKAHGRHLESRLIAIAVGTATVVNGTAAPPLVALPEADASDMEFFVDQLRLTLPVLGLDFMRLHKAAVQTTIDGTGKPGQTDVAPLFRPVSKKHGLEAQAREIDGEIVVLAGSDAAKDWSSKSDHSYSRQHAQLIKSRKLVPVDENRLRFAEDVAFRSPSAASAVIRGKPDNGRTSWKVDGSNVTYGDWQSEQAAKTSSEASNADDDGEALG